MILSIELKNHYSNFLSKIIQELVHGGYLTALGAPSLVLTTMIITNSEVNIPLLVISYLLPLIVYSFDYMRDLEKDLETNSERSKHLLKKKKFYPFLLAFYISILILLLLMFSGMNLVIFIGLITMGGLLYATALKSLTKKIPVFKNVYTVLTWSLGGTMFVSLFFSIPFSVPFLVVFIFINLKGMINAIFFDLKDYISDSKEGLKTLPVMLGRRNAINCLHILNVLAVIPLVLGVYYRIIPIISLSLIIFFFYSFYYLRTAQNADNDKVWVKLGSIADFEFMFWPLILISCMLVSNII
ncbi:UbiA prenyltransferase [Methanobacterium lacus]|uniref:UbiA prenyltransferase n=1 Tax=Methanobacterium lacus (strain AL-21) TaxID=877455 RepID=F0T977_METLA|nr:UbiA family prenyltransferase [Methanobacterium lacus]ADZ08699.1 UbiA prenyltransferase [Methanobacterium lacus]